MNIRQCASRILCGLLLVLMSAAAAAGPRELPGDSIYQLGIPLVDQNGHAFDLVQRGGKPQLVSMFYTSCPYVCPLVIDTLRKTQKALSAAEQKELDVLLVSFDPDRDNPTRLKEVFNERKLDAASWTLSRTEAPNVRKLAAVLDIQYKLLAGGDINHSTSLVLLDANGRIVARTSKIGETDPDFIAAIHKALGAD
jgi:protein SCO1/2